MFFASELFALPPKRMQFWVLFSMVLVVVYGSIPAPKDPGFRGHSMVALLSCLFQFSIRLHNGFCVRGRIPP